MVSFITTIMERMRGAYNKLSLDSDSCSSTVPEVQQIRDSLSVRFDERVPAVVDAYLEDRGKECQESVDVRARHRFGSTERQAVP